MKSLSSVFLLIGLAAPVAQAGPTEVAIIAAMRLSEQPNYSWIATVSDDARTYDIIGQTTRGGFTRVKMPVVNSLRRQLGRSATDTQIELIFWGNVRCVLQTEEGWVLPGELQLPAELDREHTSLTVPSLGSLPGGMAKGSLIRLPAPPPRNRDNQERAYSNLQLGISHPHEELGIIIGSHDDLNVEGEIVTGRLSNLGAQLLLVRDGQKEITPLGAEGTFKLWLRDGLISKYQVNLHGIIEVDTSGGQRKIEVRQTTNTLVKDVGTTKFEVPERARQKLMP